MGRIQEIKDLILSVLEEMESNQIILLKRGDLFGEREKELYKETYKELNEVYSFLEEGGKFETAYRFLQINIFLENESFFMDLFETKEFPKMFELFEFE